MSITIHRGANHIGGCVTEISTEKARVFIDLGADLTGDKKKDYSKVNIDGLTAGNAENSHLLITHYHGDHIGRITQAQTDNIYMGETAKKINMVKTKRLASSKRELIDPKEVEFLEKTKTFKPGHKLTFGDIKVTPLMTDHSAYDAYSFLIEAKGKRIFYTGDFRLHGPRGGKMLKSGFFEKYAQNIDYLICEGTNISRKEKAQTEFELMREAEELFKSEKYKYFFILCSSTNIDRIMVFYHAYNKVFNRERPFIIFDEDVYQKEILKIVTESHGKKSSFYNFVPFERNEKPSPKNGFCFLIRGNSPSKNILKRYFTNNSENSLIVYSMWKGYLDKNNESKNERLIKLLSPYKHTYMHTSGHADVETIQNVANIIKPKHIVPIHTESPEEFKKLFKNALLETHMEW